MKKFAMILAILLAMAMLAACGGRAQPITTAATPTQPVVASEREFTTTYEPDEPTTTTQAPIPDLFDLALIRRLFSMTLADFFREEGDTVDPVDWFEAGPYYSFSKYDPETYFFFDGSDPEKDYLNAMAVNTPDLLLGHYSLTLGELKEWLDAKEIKYSMSDYEGLSCSFNMGKFTLNAFPENDSAYDDAIVRRIFVKPKD